MSAVSIPAAVQTAIYERLVAHFAAAGKSWPVYDDVPDNANITCVQIGMIATQTDDILDAEYSVVVVPIVGWSVHRGQKECHEINAEVRAALNDYPLQLSSGHAYRCTVDRQFNDAERDDGAAVAYSATSIITLNIQH